MLGLLALGPTRAAVGLSAFGVSSRGGPRLAGFELSEGIPRSRRAATLGVQDPHFEILRFEITRTYWRDLLTLGPVNHTSDLRRTDSIWLLQTPPCEGNTAITKVQGATLRNWVYAKFAK